MAGRSLTRGQWAWALFDWANQPYFTLILTFIFAPYFATAVVGEAVKGQALWGYVQAGAGLAIAILSPVVGAVADASGRRKPWCAALSAVAVVAMAGLWLAAPGGPVTPIVTVVIVATVAIEMAIVFNNALLPGLAAPGRVGWLSGVGWGLGYLGGLTALVIIVFGFYLPDDPWLGLDKAAGEDARITGPFAALWLVVFSLPFFLVTPEPVSVRRGLPEAVGLGIRTLIRTVREAGRYRMIVRYLIARMIYTDGLIALFNFGGIYAAGTFGWGPTEMGVFGLIIIVFSALGSFPGGWADDRFGSRRTVLVGLIGLAAGVIAVVSFDADTLFFGLIPVAPGPGAFDGAAEIAMIAFAAVIGFFAGPVQAASRSLMVRLTPPAMTGEFFGLYALAGKATAFLAPLLVGLSTDVFETQRAALIVVLGFLGVGGCLLLRVRAGEG